MCLFVCVYLCVFECACIFYACVLFVHARFCAYTFLCVYVVRVRIDCVLNVSCRAHRYQLSDWFPPALAANAPGASAPLIVVHRVMTSTSAPAPFPVGDDRGGSAHASDTEPEGDWNADGAARPDRDDAAAPPALPALQVHSARVRVSLESVCGCVRVCVYTHVSVYAFAFLYMCVCVCVRMRSVA
jgi:hypothetical protein